jgi:pyruvate/2-oxoacid:ferredoxin oxidoreductase beta subunit
MPKTQRFELQIRHDHLAAARKAAQARGFDSVSAYFRALIEQDTRQNQQHDQLETAVASSIDRVAKEMRRLHNANQALFALTDSLVRLFLTCTPEPPADVLDATKRRAKLRYERFMLSVAQNLTGDARAALLDVLKGDPDA